MSETGQSFIDRFMRHPLAANLLMALMVLAGAFSLTRLNTQFMPTFDLNYVTVTVLWPGASADDVARSITTPLEQDLRDIDNLKEIQSISKQGVSYIILELRPGADMSKALDDAKQSVAQLRNLPQDAEQPIVTRVINYEPIAKILITSPKKLSEIRNLTHQFERQLLARGIAKIEVKGLPEQEIAIQVSSSQLAKLGLSLNQIANIIAARSQDMPSGTVGRGEIGRQLRSLSQQRDVQGFNDLPLLSDQPGHLIRLGDVAVIQQRSQTGEIQLFYKGKPAVELSLFRSKNASALHSAEIFKQWLAFIKPQLTQGVELHVYDQRWRLIKQRINVLLKNGGQGFVLILLILFGLLNRKVAFWTAVGIPVSMMAALGVLYLSGGSINMVSLFAFIMTLGIIVDDTIVIGEEALTQLQQGQAILPALQLATRKMLIPIVASSLTTIAAFLPLMLVRDIIGEIMMAIPVVVICVIIASLLESFLVLPGHLLRSLKHYVTATENGGLRQRIDRSFLKFRNGVFRRIVVYAIANRWVTLAVVFATFMLSMGMVFGGRLNFTFFPSPDSTIITANVQFSAGTPEDNRYKFLQHLETTLEQANQSLLSKNHGKSIINTKFIVLNQRHGRAVEGGQKKGEEYGHLYVELTEPDQRQVTNQQFIQAWRKRIVLSANIENFAILATRAGPPGKDIEITLSGLDPTQLKSASLTLMDQLKTYQGVNQIQDNFPFGQEELIFELSPQGHALGLTTDDIGRQLRAAFTGEIAQIFHLPHDEIEVRVILPDKERFQLKTLEQLPIVTPRGESVTLDNVVDLRAQRGFNLLRHRNLALTATVTAEVDSNQANANKILAELQQQFMPKLKQQYSVNVKYAGRAEEQADTLQDLKYGMVLALLLIYIILAWVFASYWLPVLVMLAIPLGLTGAIFGHYLMGVDLTVLSLFGFFGLSGIVINDSIILVNHYLALRKTATSAIDAIVDTAVQRFRAVLLTSLTTIAGLTPLLFERSLQAQFLIPMAISIVFGLMFSTILVLIVVPCLLAVYESSHLGFSQRLKSSRRS